MIGEFSMLVKPKNKNGTVAFLCSLTVGLILFVLSASLERYRGVVALVAVIFIVYALYVFTKYVSIEYHYDIAIIDGEPMLIVRQRIGKRNSVSCRILLSEITDVKYETREQRAAHKTPEEYKRYVYTVTMGVADTVRLTVNSRYEKCEVVLECGIEVADYLASCVAQAKAESEE